MIILLSPTTDNQAAIRAMRRAYPEEVIYEDWEFDRLSSQETSLILVDIRAENAIDAKKMARQLVSKGVADAGFTTIYLLISDLKPNLPILGFATDLCHEIVRILPSKTLRIIVPNDMNSPTLLVPPNEDSDAWTVYKLPTQHWSLSLSDTLLDEQGRIADCNGLTRQAFQGDLSRLFQTQATVVRSEDVKAQYTDEEDLTWDASMVSHNNV